MKPSDYFDSFNIQIDDRPLLVAVVSSSERNRKQTLKDQLENLRVQIEDVHADAAGIYKYIGTRYDQDWLRGVGRYAKKVGANKLLFETTDRVVRSREYHCSDNPDARPTEEQLRRARKIAGMPIVIHQNPDATNSEQRSYQRRRGRWAAKLRAPGYKKRQKEEWLKLVLALRRKFGSTLAEIRAATNFRLAKSLIGDWIKEAGL